ncbi:MAG: class I SAM-dependent methyltransferase [Hyphomicrobiales bacterium]|jgi:ubiquinone/menaquinone biosynthesis C-methylase UbiE
MTALTLEPQTMTPDTRKDARFWDGIAKKYAAQKVGDEAGYKRTLERTASFFDEDYRVLEIGCGTGSTALKLAPHAAHITASDVSSAMIDIARDKARREGATNVQFDVASAGDARYEGRGFDAVMAFNILHLVADMDALLASLRASLKPGGLLISKTPCLGVMNPLITWVAVPLMQLIGKAPSQVTSVSPDELRLATERAGFEIITVENHRTDGKVHHPYIVAKRV